MSASDVMAVADVEQIVAVAQQVFAALVDDGEFVVFERGPVEFAGGVVCAWVDMTRAGESSGIRTSVWMDGPGVELLVRALLRLGAAEEVLQEDLDDAFGEIANVVGGNLKSLLPEQAVLTLPVVSTGVTAAGEGVVLAEVPLQWRDHPLVIRLAEVRVG